MHWMIDYTPDGEINGQFRTSTVNYNLNLTNFFYAFLRFLILRNHSIEFTDV